VLWGNICVPASLFAREDIRILLLLQSGLFWPNAVLESNRIADKRKIRINLVSIKLHLIVISLVMIKGVLIDENSLVMRTDPPILQIQLYNL
jgi:hypothetical protein